MSEESLYPVWTTDAKHVYLLGRPMRADRKSFRMLNDVFAKDASTVYSASGPIREADAATFEVVGTYFDEYGRMFHSYGRDRSHVFFHSGMGRPRLVKGADPASFRWVAADYGADAARVYLEGYLVPKADPGTFRHHGGPYAADAQRCFYRTKAIPRLDPATFRVIDYAEQIAAEFARDGRHVVFRDREIIGADPANVTVRQIKGDVYPEVTDRNRTWTGAEIGALLDEKRVSRRYPGVVTADRASARVFPEAELFGMERQILTFCGLVYYRDAQKAAGLLRQALAPESVRRHVEELQEKVGVALAQFEADRIAITSDGLAFHRQFGAPVDQLVGFIDRKGPWKN